MSTRQKTKQSTKEALIRAAERLLAERGLGAVTVKDITLAAGAKNPSAVHYHFGNLEALITEVFLQRYRQIEKVQIENLDGIEGDTPNDLLLAALKTAMAPFMEACLDEGGRLYIRFCYQLTSHPRFNAQRSVTEIGLTSVSKLRDIVVSCLKDIPDDLLRVRMRQGFGISIMQAVDYADQVEDGIARPIEEAVHEAAICQAGYLTAK